MVDCGANPLSKCHQYEVHRLRGILLANDTCRAVARMGNCFSGQHPVTEAQLASGIDSFHHSLPGVNRVLYPASQHGPLQVSVSQAGYATGDLPVSACVVRQTANHQTMIALFEGLGDDRHSVAAFCRGKVFEVSSACSSAHLAERTVTTRPCHCWNCSCSSTAACATQTDPWTRCKLRWMDLTLQSLLPANSPNRCGCSFRPIPPFPAVLIAQCSTTH